MTHTSTTVNFSTVSGEFSAQISLDEDYNRSYYALEDTETKSTFLPTETAYLKLLPGESTQHYRLGSSLGSLTLANANILYDYTEDISFVLEKTGELSFTPNSAATYEWIGNDGGTPLFNGTLITLPSEIIGILRCTYKVLGDRLKLSNAVLTGEYEVLCVAIYSDRDTVDDYNVSTSVNFDDESDAVPTEVSLEVQVVDMCTGDPIPDATVSIDGYASGLTDEDGMFQLTGLVTTGTSYDIKVTATDYTDSDLDFIKNDSFTIPLITVDEDA